MKKKQILKIIFLEGFLMSAVYFIGASTAISLFVANRSLVKLADRAFPRTPPEKEDTLKIRLHKIRTIWDDFFYPNQSKNPSAFSRWQVEFRRKFKVIILDNMPVAIILSLLFCPLTTMDAYFILSLLSFIVIVSFALYGIRDFIESLPISSSIKEILGSSCYSNKVP